MKHSSDATILDVTMPDEGMLSLLQAWRDGVPGAFDALFSELYEQLRSLAHKHVARARVGQTLCTTVVMHETYLRLVKHPALKLECREHFFSLAARTMRFVLVDYAREKTSAKQGCGLIHVDLKEARDSIAPVASAEEVLLVDQALERLAALSARQAQVFELRTFGGMLVEEVADTLGIAQATVKRDWEKARLFIARELAIGTDS
jgi:RNA polymerase sigma factor (TIGR02999 family)